MGKESKGMSRGSNPPPTYPKPPPPPNPPPATDERLLTAVESIAESLRAIAAVAVAPEPDDQELDEPANPLRTMDD